MVARLRRVDSTRRCHGGGAMLPNFRAVIAAMAAAISLLVLAFGVVAMLRVAQESREGSLHADLARRGRPLRPSRRRSW